MALSDWLQRQLATARVLRAAQPTASTGGVGTVAPTAATFPSGSALPVTAATQASALPAYTPPAAQASGAPILNRTWTGGPSLGAPTGPYSDIAMGMNPMYAYSSMARPQTVGALTGGVGGAASPLSTTAPSVAQQYALGRANPNLSQLLASLY